ncbi:MAG: MarR family transcriptional regulator [Bacilli bacterium]|nr:MarR family transcriptional regulator [Bacilli bacterium]
MSRFLKNFAIIARHSNVYAGRKLAAYNIGYAEVGVLMYLAKHQDVNQATIAKFFMIDKGSVTKTIIKLIEKDYVKRTNNKDNMREKRIYLTDNGHKMIKVMSEILNESNNYLLRDISEEEIEILNKISNKILTNSIELINKENENEKKEK